MKSERRSHRRVKASNLKASLSSSGSAKELACHADIIDVSPKGIRIKLEKPLKDVGSDMVTITMMLPSSGEPFTVHCRLKSRHSDTEYGLQYAEHVEGSVDDMLFECVQIRGSEFLITSA